jgi:hypothetical protein
MLTFFLESEIQGEKEIGKMKRGDIVESKMMAR